jgi:hypothetical protein
MFESKPDSGTKMGRPRLRWLEDVENDLPELKVSRWRQEGKKYIRIGFCLKGGQGY